MAKGPKKNTKTSLKGRRFGFTPGVMQGQAKMPTRMFNGTKAGNQARRKKSNRAAARVEAGLDAFHTNHLALPRAIGPYSVIKTTTKIPVLTSTAGRVIAVVGPCTVSDAEPSWTNVCAFVSAVAENPINGVNNAQRFGFSTPAGSWGDSNVCPAAFSVQLICTSPLQISRGDVRVGRSRMAFNLNNQTKTWFDFADEWAQYSAPRLCSGGKLALRGVHTDSRPVNMNRISDFTTFRILTSTGQGVTLDGTQPTYDGFTPTVYEFEKTADPVEYTLLVTCEWRVRFDPRNPAYAAHQAHKPAPASCWDAAINSLGRTVHGTRDIVETVAAAGAAAGVVGLL